MNHEARVQAGGAVLGFPQVPQLGMHTLSTCPYQCFDCSSIHSLSALHIVFHSLLYHRRFV